MADTDENLNKSKESFAKALKELAFKTERTSGAINDLADKSIATMVTPLQALSSAVGNNTKMFEELSSVGSSFGNNLQALSIAAAESRVSQQDFAEILKANNKNFAALGSNVAAGGKEFAKLGKDLFDSGVGEQLMQMGYSAKDLNDILALQIGIQRTANDTSAAGMQRTVVAAAELAMQMDELAKLTGMTKKEQMDAMKERQVDMQLEATMRQETRNMDKTEAAKYVSTVKAMLAEARATQGAAAETLLKEALATGTVNTKSAREYASISGEAGQKLMESAMQVRQGNLEAAKSALEESKAANMRNQENDAYLNAVRYGIPAVKDVVKENMIASQAQYEGLKNINENFAESMSSTVTALDKQREAIRKEQEAREGTTSASIAAAARLSDGVAAATRMIRGQIADPRGAVQQATMEVARTRQQGTQPGDRPRQTYEDYERGVRQREELGASRVGPTSTREKYAEQMGIGQPVVDFTDKSLGLLIQGIDKSFKVGDDLLGKINQEVNLIRQGIPKRHTGTVGETGQFKEPMDTLAYIKKGETVLTEDQAKNLLSNSKMQGMNELADIFKGFNPKSTSSKPSNLSSDEFGNSIKSTMSSIFKDFKIPSVQEFKSDIPKIQNIQESSIDDDRSLTAEELYDKRMTEIKESSKDSPFDLKSVFGSMTQAFTQKEAAKESAAVQKTEQTAASAKSETSTKEPMTAPQMQAATLDDVVDALKSLNSAMNRLTNITDQNKSLMESQVKATRSMSGNLYGAY